MPRFNDYRGKRIALKLRECVKLVRSKNAGPFELTIDVMFSSPTLFRSCVKTGVLGPQNIAKIYDIPDKLIKVFEIDCILLSINNVCLTSLGKFLRSLIFLSK